MPDPDMRKEGFLLQTDICQPSTGVKTEISITSLQISGMKLLRPELKFEVKDVNNWLSTSYSIAHKTVDVIVYPCLILS